MPDEPEVPAPSKLGKAITFQSLLQYVLMALVGVLAYLQNEGSKQSAWNRSELREARQEARDDRKSEWKEVAALRAQMEVALAEIRGARRFAEKAQITAEKAQAVGEKTLKAVEKIE